MIKVKKLFSEYDMTWPKVIILAIISAVFTAAMLLIPATEKTSFRDIGVNLDVWILFAMFIILNCKKWQEASLKTFVFFLISQPLIYLLQIPFGAMSFAMALSWYKQWAVITVLTLPGAAIAFLVKKQNVLSILVLSVATGYLAYMGVNYLQHAISNFPYHLLSAIFCFLLSLFLVLVSFDKKMTRANAFAVIAIVIVAAFVFTSVKHNTSINLGSGNWSYSIDKPDKVTASITDDGKIKLRSKHDGTCYLYLTNDSGETKTYLVTITGGNIRADRMED